MNYFDKLQCNNERKFAEILVRLQNDILIALDQRKEVILILLDFSAAFDTVDHLIMIERLSKRFGFAGSVLDWFRSYRQGRSHVVKIENAYRNRLMMLAESLKGQLSAPCYSLSMSLPSMT